MIRFNTPEEIEGIDWEKWKESHQERGIKHDHAAPSYPFVKNRPGEDPVLDSVDISNHHMLCAMGAYRVNMKQDQMTHTWASVDKVPSSFTSSGKDVLIVRPPEGSAADGNLKRSVMMFSDLPIALSRLVEGFNVEDGGQVLTFQIFTHIQNRGASATHNGTGGHFHAARLSTKKWAALTYAIVFVDGIVSPTDLANSMPGCMSRDIPDSLSFALALANRPKSKADEFKGSFQSIAVSEKYDSMRDEVKELAAANLANMSHAHQNKRDVGSNDWARNVQWKFHKPEKLMLEALARQYTTTHEMTTLVSQLNSAFDSHDDYSEWWRMKIFETATSMIVEPNWGGWPNMLICNLCDPEHALYRKTKVYPGFGHYLYDEEWAEKLYPGKTLPKILHGP